MANIQITEEAFVDICRLLYKLEAYSLDADTTEIVKRLNGAVNAKFEAMNKRKAFTAYKTAQIGSDERESARQSYLDKAGISADYRSKKEMEV